MRKPVSEEEKHAVAVARFAMRHSLLLACACVLALGAKYDPDEVLKRVTGKVLASASQVPNYTCVQTVNRQYFAPTAAILPRACDVLLRQRRHPTMDMVLRPVSTDRLRLDVTLAGGGEIFSWSGASRFEDAGIERVVRSGPISTGAFAAFLIAVFKTDVKKFVFEKTIADQDRTLMRYSFDVSRANSHYKIKMSDSSVFIAYTGAFEVDPETADVVRMTVTTGEVPLATGLCQTATTMDFAKVRIGDGQFLLPRQTSQRFVYPSADETENTTAFTNCREFRGNSTVTFFPDSESSPHSDAKSPSSPVTTLPGGLTFSLVLTTMIPTGTAAAGDPFSAMLADPIRDSRGKMLAPKGAVVEGHLIRVQSYFRPPEVVVVLKPETLWIRGAQVPLNAARDRTRAPAARKGQGKKGMEIFLPWPGEESAGSFRFSGQDVVVPRGFRSGWKTVAPPK
jgi:hypothetical protein